MATKNDITGDVIQTKYASKAYRENYDLIFRQVDDYDIDPDDPDGVFRDGIANTKEDKR